MLSLLLALTANAATYDPELRWRTLSTEHFNIHFHQGEEVLAEEFSFMVEDVYDTMTDELLWQPRRRTELVLVDRTDSANGFAGVIPYNAITIYVTHPKGDSTLSLHESWPEAIFTHELTHVLHMDTNHAWVRLARAVVGRIATTNDISPRWMVEGLATFQETRYTSGGRGRTPQVEMIKRTSVLADDIPPLGNLDGYQADPPGGNLRYLYGQDFMQFVADESGEDVWTRWTHTYGSGLPYILPSKKVFGRELVPMYQDWKQHITERYMTQLAPVHAEGVREGRRISEPEASCAAPAYSPDGENLVWSCSHLDIGARIWMSDGDGYAPEVLLIDRGASSFTWRKDSEAFVYAGLHVVSRFNTWSDVWMHTLGGGTRSLTSAKRARDPDFSPDGSALLVVTNSVATNQLKVLTVDQRLTEITAYDDDTQIETPRYSPDGSHIVASIWQRGRRDLWMLTADGTPVRRLTADNALDIHPRWSADGRWLYFSSDRSGIPNIYAIEVQTERLYQITNVETGAFAPFPHPTGKDMAYSQWGNRGWEVRILPLDPADFLDRGVLPASLTGEPALAELVGPVEPEGIELADVIWSGDETRWRRGGPILPHSEFGQAPGEGIDTFDQDDVRDVFGEELDYDFTIPPHRYNPLPMLAPRFVAPFFQTTPFAPQRFKFIPFGVQAVVATSSSDVLRHFAYSARATYRTDADFIGASASVTLNKFLPLYSLSVSRRAVPFPVFTPDPLRIGTNGVPELTAQANPYWERRTTWAAQISYPYRPQTSIFGNYTLTLRQAKDGIPDNAYRPRIPARGSIGKLSGGWRYAWTRPTRLAVSTEDGRVFGFIASVTHPWLGTQITDANDLTQGITQVQLTSELREYRVNPLIPNHVVAFRAAAGVTLGQESFLGNYQLGGTFGDGGFASTPDEFRMLRGYPIAAAVGDSYWLTGMEYRFPIWRIDRGFGTLPAFLRYLSGSAFIDAGNALSDPTNIDQITDGTLIGVGAELRLATVLGWTSGITGRVGYGAALTPGGFRLGDARGAYFRFGGSF
ncbi:MAG: hypothetical protein ACJATT_000137 [Myxococcota bacterium]